MTDDERATWAALTVTITGLVTALAALRGSDLQACDAALASALESGRMFADRVAVIIGPDRHPRSATPEEGRSRTNKKGL